MKYQLHMTCYQNVTFVEIVEALLHENVFTEIIKETHHCKSIHYSLQSESIK